jgi:hypothetical protein
MRNILQNSKSNVKTSFNQDTYPNLFRICVNTIVDTGIYTPVRSRLSGSKNYRLFFVVITILKNWMHPEKKDRAK